MWKYLQSDWLIKSTYLPYFWKHSAISDICTSANIRFWTRRETLNEEVITLSWHNANADGIISKTFQSGLREKHRLEKPFMFENLNTVCLVKLFKYYISKWPAELRLTGPLYLAVIDKPASDIGFKKSPVGVNTLDNIMKNMIKNSTLANTITKKVTNHSARKTLVKKLKKNMVPKSDIITITGHTTEAGLDDYDSGNEEHT